MGVLVGAGVSVGAGVLLASGVALAVGVAVAGWGVKVAVALSGTTIRT
jgi:hypothetical protein